MAPPLGHGVSPKEQFVTRLLWSLVCAIQPNSRSHLAESYFPQKIPIKFSSDSFQWALPQAAQRLAGHSSCSPAHHIRLCSKDLSRMYASQVPEDKDRQRVKETKGREMMPAAMLMVVLGSNSILMSVGVNLVVFLFPSGSQRLTKQEVALWAEPSAELLPHKHTHHFKITEEEPLLISTIP